MEFDYINLSKEKLMQRALRALEANLFANL
jgi:hypothetical protein